MHIFVGIIKILVCLLGFIQTNTTQNTTISNSTINTSTLPIQTNNYTTESINTSTKTAFISSNPTISSSTLQHTTIISSMVSTNHPTSQNVSPSTNKTISTLHLTNDQSTSSIIRNTPSTAHIISTNADSNILSTKFTTTNYTDRKTTLISNNNFTTVIVTSLEVSTNSPPSVSNKEIVTSQPAKSGQYESKVKVRCRLTEEVFKPQYNDRLSSEYIYFANLLFYNLQRQFMKSLLRLVQIIIFGLNSGSVVADMQLVFASDSSISNSVLTDIVTVSIKTAYNNTIDGLNITITQSTTKVTDPIPGWGIALIVIGCIIFVVAITLAVYFGIKYSHNAKNRAGV